MKATKQTLLILFILFLTVPVFAADTIDYVGYKELYENQKEYNQGVLNTIDTALQIFVAACLLVIGGSVWFNVVKYEQLKKQIVDKANETLKDQNILIGEALERLRIDSLDQFRENTDNNKSAFLANDLSIKKIITEMKEMKDKINPSDSSIDELRKKIKDIETKLDFFIVRHPKRNNTL